MNNDIPSVNIPEDVLRIMNRLFRSGHGVWLVGGVIRDHLLGIEPKDWDLATDAAPEQVMKLFKRVVPVGIRHGTVQIRTERRGVEVTSVPFRGEEGIIRDLSRRDFSVNAMALSFPEAQLLDLHNGRNDLEKRVLRATGNPLERFREDPLRVLRAARFVSVYGFGIEERTFEAMREEAHGLSYVAGERIRDELCKLLLGDHVVEAFGWMKRSGTLDVIFSEILECCGRTQREDPLYDDYEHTLLTVSHCPRRLRVRLAALFHDIARPEISEGDYPSAAQDENRAGALLSERIMERWRVSHKEIREVSTLVGNCPRKLTWSGAALRRLLSRVGIGLVDDLLDLAEADLLSCSNASGLEELRALRVEIGRELERNPPLGLKDLAVGGADVMKALDLRPGPVVGEILSRLHEMALDDPDLNERKILMDFIRKEYDKKNL